MNELSTSLCFECIGKTNCIHIVHCQRQGSHRNTKPFHNLMIDHEVWFPHFTTEEIEIFQCSTVIWNSSWFSSVLVWLNKSDFPEIECYENVYVLLHSVSSLIKFFQIKTLIILFYSVTRTTVSIWVFILHSTLNLIYKDTESRRGHLGKKTHTLQINFELPYNETDK